MTTFKQFWKPYGGILLVSLLHWIITFFTDSFVFTTRGVESPVIFWTCKLLLLLLLFFLYRSLYRILFSPNKKETTEYQVIKYALPYLIPMIAVLIFKLPEGFLSNDETLIFGEASRLANYNWFYYLTTYYYIVTMMLVPCWLGPILAKVLIQLLVTGYCVYRLSHSINFKYGKFLYLAFLLFPVLAYTTSAHRIPIYYLLYLFFVFKMLMDRLEHKSIDRRSLCGLLFLSAVLTQWRTEGIYMVGLAPILFFVVYPNLRQKKTVLQVIIASLFIQYLVSVPQNGILPSRMGDQADNRMGPFYAYTITNMYRNGLDLQKNKDALAQVDRYLSLDTIASINQDLGEINYEDVLILYYEGYTGKRPEADNEDYEAYVKACKNIFLHNPGVMLKTRIGAFCYAATPYDIVWPTGGIRGWLSFGISMIKVFAYNLFLPHLIVLALWLYSIIRKRAYTFFVMSGLCCHWFIVFILAPASYFKYYFPIYMTAYFYVVLLGIQAFYRRYHKEKGLSFIQ